MLAMMHPAPMTHHAIAPTCSQRRVNAMLQAACRGGKPFILYHPAKVFEMRNRPSVDVDILDSWTLYPGCSAVPASCRPLGPRAVTDRCEAFLDGRGSCRDGVASGAAREPNDCAEQPACASQSAIRDLVTANFPASDQSERVNCCRCHINPADLHSASVSRCALVVRMDSPRWRLSPG